MSIVNAGMFIISFRIKKSKADCGLATENAKMFFVGHPILVIPDGTLVITSMNATNLQVVDCVIDLNRKGNFDALTILRDVVTIKKRVFKVFRPDLVESISLFVSSERFGEQKIVTSPMGVLCIESIYEDFYERSPFDEVPLT